jgi:hypothetical protein
LGSETGFKEGDCARDYTGVRSGAIAITVGSTAAEGEGGGVCGCDDVVVKGGIGTRDGRDASNLLIESVANAINSVFTLKKRLESPDFRPTSTSSISLK